MKTGFSPYSLFMQAKADACELRNYWLWKFDKHSVCPVMQGYFLCPVISFEYFILFYRTIK